MSMETEKILVMENGETHVIIGEDAKYWICNGFRLRKKNKAIVPVQELVVGEALEEPPKKRRPAQKKKKEEIEEKSDE